MLIELQNWSRWKKYYQLFLVALYACAFSYGENTLGAAWTTVSEETGVSLTSMNGGSALNYLLLVSAQHLSLKFLRLTLK
jgi:hypothetical protein